MVEDLAVCSSCGREAPKSEIYLGALGILCSGCIAPRYPKGTAMLRPPLLALIGFVSAALPFFLNTREMNVWIEAIVPSGWEGDAIAVLSGAFALSFGLASLVDFFRSCPTASNAVSGAVLALGLFQLVTGFGIIDVGSKQEPMATNIGVVAKTSCACENSRNNACRFQENVSLKDGGLPASVHTYFSKGYTQSREKAEACRNGGRQSLMP